MTAIKLRDYQRGAIDAVFAAWADGMRRPAVVLPTGAGKTVVFAELIREFRDGRKGNPFDHGHRRVIVLAHRDELVDQAIAKVRAVAPGLDVGKVKATDNDINADVMVCSVATLASAKRLARLVRTQQFLGNVGLIITDECHHAAAASYKKIYAAFPDALQLGVTATMARGDRVGLGSTWDDVVFKRSVLWMISKGHLTDVRTKRIDLKGFDLGDVKRTAGDYGAGDLGRALMENQADDAIARAYREHAGDRQGIVFTPTVETAQAAMEALDQSGIPSEMVSGATPREHRSAIYEWFRQGKVQVLVNCMVLTEGFDAPWAEVAVIARPTQSAPLYTQMVGRVLRPWPGKTEALVLDLVGASANKLRTLIDLNPGEVEGVRDGESLAEAVEREEEAKNRKVPAGSIAFELRARDVDSFAGSETAWVRTPKGVMFVSCGDTKVFLWPALDESGLWDVRTVHKEPSRWAFRETVYKGLDLGSAMAWGEAVAEDYATFGTGRSAAWRRKKPSEKMLALGVAMGVANAGLMSTAELSGAIDRVQGARLFDPRVKG